MKNFDWIGFQNGNFEVKCVTREEMNDFLIQCEDHGYLWCSGAKPTTRDYYKDAPIYFDGEDKEFSYSAINFKDYVTWIIEPTLKDKLTWREVFSNIQEGEIYECGDYWISLFDGRINIGREGYGICFDDNQQLTKKQEMEQEVEQVDFQEAQLALEEGKIIKSNLTGFYYKLHNDSLKRSIDNEFTYWEVTDLAYYEITDKWIIIEN